MPTIKEAIPYKKPRLVLTKRGFSIIYTSPSPSGRDLGWGLETLELAKEEVTFVSCILVAIRTVNRVSINAFCI